ncbi:Histone deacetylase clr3 [Mycena kentingensis (nom. inval.)]|nr:Histone deacetylase clr3 [Mycena kentingensis (nom. inval.)]
MASTDAMDVDLDGQFAQPQPEAHPAALFNTPPQRQRSPIPRASSVPLRLEPHTDMAFVYSSEMMFHAPVRDDPEHNHPEQPERISSIWHELAKTRLAARGARLPIRPVEKAEVLLVHSEDLWDRVEEFQTRELQEFIDSVPYFDQMSLYACNATTRAAKLSCGGVVEACLAVARGPYKKAFAVVRPPGHHAEPENHMGFCFFNNVAVAARVVQQKTPLKKILILDWDVHHGNGTQRAFNEDPSVLYISIHRYENGNFYPCGPFGALQSCGDGPGRGFSVNIPWPTPGMGDAEYIHAFQKVVMPIAMEFAPDLVIISAGFDAARGDQLGECDVTPEGYAHMTYMLAGLANGRLVVALEGGYNLKSISDSAVAVTRVLLGEAPPALPSLVASDVGAETVWLAAREQSKYWSRVDPKGCEPREDAQSLALSIPEILKLHRQYHLYTRHQMMQIPLVGKDIEDRFAAQIMCTQNIFEKDTLVFLIHEFGNLRAEMVSALTCDADLERSYLIDISEGLMDWANEEGFSVLDVNLFPRPAEDYNRTRTTDDLQSELVAYLWDNYVQLSSASNIVLVGHGSACSALISLINLRATSIIRNVKAVVQIIGNQPLRTPKNSVTLREWFVEHSFLAVSASHDFWRNAQEKDIKKQGTIHRFDTKETAQLMLASLPHMKKFVRDQLSAATD